MTKALAAAFAHLLGLPAAAAAPTPAPRVSSDDDDKQKEGESDDDYKKRKESKKAKAAQESEEARARELEAQAEVERLDGEQTRGDTPEANARRNERARCRAIFASAAAGKRPDLAAAIAFDTNMTRGEALTILENVATERPKPEAKAPGLKERMETEQIPHVDPAAPAAPDASDPKVIAQRVIAAGNKARGVAA